MQLLTRKRHKTKSQKIHVNEKKQELGCKISLRTGSIVKGWNGYTGEPRIKSKNKIIKRDFYTKGIDIKNNRLQDDPEKQGETVKKGMHKQQYSGYKPGYWD